MTLLELLAKASGLAGPKLVELLEAIIIKIPDLAPTAQEWLAKLNAAVSPVNLIALAEALPKELANIGSGKLDPRDHAGDAI